MPIDTASGHPQYSGSLITPRYIHSKFITRLYQRLIFPEICNMDFESDFKNGGDSLTVYREQEGNSRIYKKGQKLEVDYLDSEPINLVVDRARYYNLGLEGLDKIQIENVEKRVQSYIRGSVLRAKQGIEGELLSYVPTEVGAINQGNSAGEASRSIRLGTAAAGQEIDVNATTVIGWLVDIMSVLEESGLDSGEWVPWIVLPNAGKRVLRNSEKITNRDYNGSSGDGMTTTMTGKIPRMIEGFNVYISDRVPFTLDASGRKIFQIIAGVKPALAFYMQSDKTRGPIAHPDFNIDLMQGFMSYGFKVVADEQIVLSYARFSV